MFEIKGSYKIKQKEMICQWPCKSDKERNITIYDDDVLTKREDGTFMKQTGLGCFGIIIDEKDLIKVDKTIKLQLI